MIANICIDPGHQKEPDYEEEPIYPGSLIKKPKCAPGTFGIISRVSEHQIVLDISFLLKGLLEKNGYSVIMTRDKDDVHISNKERAEFANRNKSDVCIKIHCNGVRNSLKLFGFLKSGVMTLVPAQNRVSNDLYKRSKIIAELVHKSIILNTGLQDRGVIERNDLAGFNWSEVPVILLELGYLTNPKEDRLLNNEKFKLKIAKAILEGLKEVNHVVSVSRSNS